MRYGMILALVAVSLCGSFANSKEKKVKYIAKYSTSKDPSVVECVYDEKTNQLILRRGAAVIEVTQYATRNEFMAERRELGRSFALSQQIREPDYSDDWTMKYDVQGRLAREEGNNIILEWTEWDKKKRNIKGKLLFKGWKIDLDLSIVYDDQLRTNTTTMTVPDSVRDIVGGLPETIVVVYDEFHNELSRKTLKFNGDKEEETKSILEYKEME